MHFSLGIFDCNPVQPICVHPCPRANEFLISDSLFAGCYLQTYEAEPRSCRNELIFSVIATLYSVLMIYAGTLKYLPLSALIYVPGTLLSFLARREQGRKIFTFGEWFVFTVALITAISALYALLTGRIII